VTPRFTRRRPPDPEARPRSGRYSWAPATLSTARTEDVDIEREVREILAALRDRGPMDRRELRRVVEARFWGPGRFSSALWLARRRGLVVRQGGRLAAAGADDGTETG
jgi:hypothetical protein